jgi:hypothetical protein
MRTPSFVSTLALLLLTAALSCVRTPLSGGTGTETINTFALLSDGTPARGALAMVIDERGWMDSLRQGASPVVSRAVADSNGRVELTIPINFRGFNIQVDHTQQGALVPTVDSDLPAGDTIRLKPYASYTGSFSGPANRITRMFLSGSAYTVSIGSAGNFYFDKVAPAAFTVIGSTRLLDTIVVAGAVTLAPGNKTVDTTLNASSYRLLIDNFENGVGPTALGQFIPTMSWYAVSDSGLLSWSASGNAFYWTNFSSSPTGRSFVSLSPVPGDNGGTALSFTAVLTKSATNLFTLSGMSFEGVNPNGVNLSSMTGFSLRCRGNGTLWVEFKTRRLDSASQKAQNRSSYAYTITLSTTMTSYRIPVDSLRIVPGNFSMQQYPWSEESKNVKTMEFEFSEKTNRAGDTLRLILDDLYLEGVQLDDVMH